MASMDIRLRYVDAVRKCRETLSRVYLAKNGEGELAAMDIASFKRRERELCAQRLVLESIATRLSGEKDYTLEESKNLIEALIEGK